MHSERTPAWSQTQAYRSVLSAGGSTEMPGASRWLDANAGAANRATLVAQRAKRCLVFIANVYRCGSRSTFDFEHRAAIGSRRCEDERVRAVRALDARGRVLVARERIGHALRLLRRVGDVDEPDGVAAVASLAGNDERALIQREREPGGEPRGEAGGEHRRLAIVDQHDAG